MNPNDAKTTVNFIERVVKESKLVEPIRLVSTLRTNGYVGSEFEKRNFQYKYVEGFDLPTDQLDPTSDVLYVEIPDDYSYTQHEQLAKTMASSIYVWVVYTKVAGLVKKYYSDFTYESDLFTNGL